MANTFALILVILTFFTGIVWVIDKVRWAPVRDKARQRAQVGEPLNEKMRNNIQPENVLIENARSLFPVIAVVFVLRSFLYEPFQIPSGSMMPTLLIGDFILVEKYSYGVKEPLWHNTLIPTSKPKRGDVAVFKYPEDTRIDFIKRVIGLPGDRIVYKDKQMYLVSNCAKEQCGSYKKLDTHFLQDKTFSDERGVQKIYNEVLGKTEHQILITPIAGERISRYFQQQDTVTYQYEWVVPQGHYFVMGDNRDNSEDSRFWGFVPEKNLVGKAVFTWISFELDRDANGFLPTWIPSAVRFGRIGKIK
ncbi:signal peptidase I [Psychromonas ossibalaenae]|uniref:signal peptidase I n=1 Tax=Psychromonas ossibalaenae TaxID=444922 RepID=UPI0003692775|nr:signal peptidase I [Psychromonas ossibalaenae]